MHLKQIDKKPFGKKDRLLKSAEGPLRLEDKHNKLLSARESLLIPTASGSVSLDKQSKRGGEYLMRSTTEKGKLTRKL